MIFSQLQTGIDPIKDELCNLLVEILQMEGFTNRQEIHTKMNSVFAKSRNCYN